MYASRGGNARRLTQHEARIAGGAAPKDLVNIWHSQQSTDPKMAPAHGSERDFRCQAQVRAQCQRHRFKQASNNCRVLGNALTRVNIANRYLGNKACEYETRVAIPAAVKKLVLHTENNPNRWARQLKRFEGSTNLFRCLAWLRKDTRRASSNYGNQKSLRTHKREKGEKWGWLYLVIMQQTRSLLEHVMKLIKRKP